MSLTISNPSITHTFGNVACVAIDYMQSFFPSNFFTKTHISTKMAHRQLDAFRAKSGFWKNKKPMLILRPRIEYDDSGKWFYGSTMVNRVTNSFSPMEFADLVPLVHDPKHGVGVHFLWNRYKIIYDIVIVVDTYNKQINIMNDLKNRMNIECPFLHRTYLEAYIPKTVIYNIADHLHIPREDTASILEYLNTYSKTPITYKLHNGNGKDEFFMMYPTNIEVITSDLSADDGETRGIIADTYTIGLAVSMEFYGVASWYTFIGDRDDSILRAPYDDDLSKNGDRIVPFSSIPLDYDLGLEKGWKIFSSPFYFAEAKTNLDVTDIHSILDAPSLRSIIRHHRNHHIPLEPFVQFRCFKGREELPRGVKGFDIDLDKKCIYTYNPEGNVSYRLFVLVNSLAINQMAAEITNFKEEK
jgi:hypothetical protein